MTKVITTTDPRFFERSDAHITLSNTQVKEAPADRVAASMTFSAACFNAWFCMTQADSAQTMAAGRDQVIEEIIAQYRRMLEQNYDQYVQNFDTLKKAKPKGQFETRKL